jgi:hypothetical protein
MYGPHSGRLGITPTADMCSHLSHGPTYIFTENVLVRRRAEIKRNKVARFKDIPEGLAQLSIRRFLRVVDEADFRIISFEAVPIRKLRFFANLLTREFTTSVVRCRLKPRTELSRTERRRDD